MKRPKIEHLVNIILFEDREVGLPLRRDDHRVIHMLDVLRRKLGESTDVGIVDGPRGKAVLKSVGDEYVELEFEWDNVPEILMPIDLVVGLSRPQTSRRVLQEATSLGVRQILFVHTERGEPSYATSKLWTTDEWKRLVRGGVQQAFTTRFPRIQIGVELADSIAATNSVNTRICLDNYESSLGLLDAVSSAESIVLAIGSERGWTDNERNLFRKNGFTLAHLGERPLRTETAAIAAISIVAARMQRG